MEPKDLTPEESSINAAVNAKLTAFYNRARTLFLVGLTGVIGGAGTHYVLTKVEKAAVKDVEKDVLKEVPVPKYIDRPVPVPIPPKPFGSVCPNCKTNHWAYPPGTGPGDVGQVGALKK